MERANPLRLGVLAPPSQSSMAVSSDSAADTSPLSGLLVIAKPLGLTSATVVRIVRRRAGDVKTGHAGTLDPLATGVLILCLGKATKAVERVMALDKRYRAVVDLSARSSTDDGEGEITPVTCDAPSSREAVERALLSFTGRIVQSPPIYSALKVGGVCSYRLARRGDAVALRPREVTVHQIDLIGYDFPRVTIDVHCGKGVYIRALARDLGVALGTGGYLAELSRTAVGPYNLESARTLESLPEALRHADLLPVPAQAPA